MTLFCLLKRLKKLNWGAIVVNFCISVERKLHKGEFII